MIGRCSAGCPAIPHCLRQSHHLPRARQTLISEGGGDIEEIVGGFVEGLPAMLRFATTSLGAKKDWKISPWRINQ
jgi:hypothetical protein